jgi:hypothetical protein
MIADNTLKTQRHGMHFTTTVRYCGAVAGSWDYARAMSASGGAGTGEGKTQQKHHTRGVAENKQKGRGSGAEEKMDRKG